MFTIPSLLYPQENVELQAAYLKNVPSGQSQISLRLCPMYAVVHCASTQKQMFCYELTISNVNMADFRLCVVKWAQC